MKQPTPIPAIFDVLNLRSEVDMDLARACDEVAEIQAEADAIAALLDREPTTMTIGSSALDIEVSTSVRFKI